MATKPIKTPRNLSGLTTRRCPVCRGERLIRADRFLPHWGSMGQRCPGGGKRSSSVAYRRD